MKTPSIRPVRCAIYTRVSTEHGHDQEFNSLDAQHDAASAYIKSQAHAGWTLIRSRYDDGGYSGGSTDRPDLQRLLDDIRARKIDVTFWKACARSHSITITATTIAPKIIHFSLSMRYPLGRPQFLVYTGCWGVASMAYDDPKLPRAALRGEE